MSCIVLLLSIRDSKYFWNVRSNDATRSLQITHMMMGVYVARVDEKGDRVEVKVSKVRVRSQWEALIVSGALPYHRKRLN